MDANILTETLTNGALFVVRSWIRYFIICGGAFGLFWVLLSERLQHRLCQPTRPSRAMLLGELRTSLSGIVFFLLPTILSIPLYHAGYLHIDVTAGPSHPAAMVGSFLLFIVGADAWFYWVHRMMHDSRIYRWTHQLHHRSIQPTPLASYSFSLIEGVVLGLYLPLVLLVVPLNIWVVVAFILFFAVLEAYVHLGYELLPRGFASGRIGKHIGTSVFHNMHHEDGAYNFGVYFTWWDRLMGTIHPRYAERFDEVTAAPLFARPSARASDGAR